MKKIEKRLWLIVWILLFAIAYLLLNPTTRTETKTILITDRILVEVPSIEYLPHVPDARYKTVPSGIYLREITGAIGAYYGEGVIVCENLKNVESSIFACMHELGHMVDDFTGKPSHTVEFEIAVDKYAEENNREYGTLADMILNWPDILGNKPIDGWGGYEELYASMWSTFTLQYWEMPAEFEPFFVIPTSPYK